MYQPEHALFSFGKISGLLARTGLAFALLLPGQVGQSSPTYGSRPVIQLETPLYLPLVLRNSTPPSSQELIRRALEAGVIDYPTSLVYRAYALFGDPRLPAQLKGSGSSGEDNGLFFEARDKLDTLPAEIQALMRPFLVRPDQPESIFSLAVSQGDVSLPAEATANADLPCFRLNKWAALASLKEGIKIKVWAQCTGNYEADILHVLAVMEGLWGPMTAHMGEPIPDMGGTDGGDSKDIDIYLLNPLSVPPRPGGNPLDEDSFAAAPSAPPYANGTSSGYIIVDRLTIRNGLIKSILAHEFFHTLEERYNQSIFFDAANKEWWFVEASAEWAASYFAREDSPFIHQRFAYGFQNSEESLHLSVPVGDPRHRHLYQAYIWPFFMEQEKGAQTIASVWKELYGAGQDWEFGLGRINAYLPFNEHFRRFALRNLNLSLQPGDPIFPRYINLDPKFPDGIDPRKQAVDYLSMQGPFPSSGSYSKNIPSLKAVYYRFFLTADVEKVELSLASLAGNPELDVDAVVKIRGKGWEQRPLNGKAEVTLCDVEDFYLIISNHDTQENASIAASFSLKARAEPCACGDIASIPSWSGSVSFAYDHHAVNSELDFKISQGGGVMTLLQQTGVGPGGAAYMGEVTGNAYVDETITDLTSDPPEVTTIKGSGDPLPDYYGERGSWVYLNINLTDCTYNFGSTLTVNAVTSDGSTAPVQIGSVRSGDRSIPSTKILSGNAYFPAHSVMWGQQNGGEAYFPLSSGFSMFLLGVATDDNAGSARVIWNLSPSVP